MTDGDAMLTRGRVAGILAAVSALVVLGAWQDLTIEEWYHLRDAGFFIQGGARLAMGEMPYRDYIYAWPPLTALAMAASFQIFGYNLWAAKLPLAIATAANAPLAYRWLREPLGSSAALAGALATLALAPLLLRLPYTTSFGIAPTLFVFIQLQRMRPGRLYGPALLAGLACGVCMGIKHNIGILIGIAVWVHLLVLTPYAELTHTRDSAKHSSIGWIRFIALSIALAALIVLAVNVPTARRTLFITLMPAAVLTSFGGIRAYRIDAKSLPGDAAELVKAALCVAAGIVVAVLPWVLWLQSQDALQQFFDYGLVTKSEGGTNWASFYGKAFSPPWPSRGVLWCCGALALGIVAVGAKAARLRLASAAGCFVLLLIAWLSESSFAFFLGSRYTPLLLLASPLLLLGKTEAKVLYPLAVVCAWSATVAFPAPTAPHVSTAMLSALALAMAIGWRVCPPDNRAGRFAMIALVCAMASGWWTQWFNAVAQKTRSGWERREIVRVPGPHGGTWMPKKAADDFVRVNEYVLANTSPDSPLVAWPSLALLNFYTGRPNPTQMDYFWPGLVGEQDEQELLAQFELIEPPILILDYAPSPIGYRIFEHYHPGITEYINDHYERDGPLAGSFALMKRRTDD